MASRARLRRWAWRSWSDEPRPEPGATSSEEPEYDARSLPTMDLHQTAHRIIVNHWRLIIAMICLGITAVGITHLGSPKLYSASTRLVLDTQDPKTWAEAGAISDTAKGFATSPALVRRAVANARVAGRDAEQIAKERVTVQPLGESG